jgi:1-deoxy-D-xylulose-5-phosphate synthase
VLERVNSPEDLKGLSIEELRELCQALRESIIRQVAKTGGHLAPSLGVVELTVALHVVFDSPRDKLIWDVGHQSYAHKLLTGRRGRFHTLRQRGGISGFPKPSESPHDAFGTGHSSTSISAALGFLEARHRLGEHYKVVAIIGDGAMTAGLAFEGLNHAGQLKRDLIVVLNDNEMSISRNVGALSAYLNRLLTGEFYQRLRGMAREALRSIPRLGPSFSRLAERLEEALKGVVLPGLLFEELGFRYIGPIDGHNLELLIETFQRLKKAQEPVLVHVVTRKGKGYAPAEADPSCFHGTGPFDVASGRSLKSAPSMSDAFGQALTELALGEPRLVAITAAMKEGTGLRAFEEAHPGRLYDVGIAEPHAVVFAAALAKAGLRPVVAIYSTFLQRAYDMLIHDVALQALPVVFALDRAGLVGEDGPTHHGMFDLCYLRHIPGFTVMAPKDAPELKEMLRLALTLQGPVAVRYGRGKALELSCQGSPLQLGRAELLQEGGDLFILALGAPVAEALKAVELLKDRGISAGLYNMRFLKPLDAEAVRHASETGRILTLEDGSVVGGFGSAVAEALAEEGLGAVRLRRLGWPDAFIEHGAQEELRRAYGLDAEGLARKAEELLGKS